jgi:type VI secretion system secreted protein VgrG
MNKRLLELEPTSLFGKDAVLVSFSGRETMSRPFEFTLAIDSPLESVEPQNVIGKPLAVRIDLGDGKERFFHGYICHMQRGESQTSKDKAGIQSHGYTVRIVPWTWFMSRASRCFVYLPEKKEKSIQDVLDALIKRVKSYGHVEAWLDPSGASILKKRMVEHCVQYRETDFNFLSRTLERYGVYYHFKHEKDKHTLVLSDKKNYPKCVEAEIDFPGDFGTQVKRDRITAWDRSFEFVPGKFEQVDYDPLQPASSLRVSEPGLTALSNNSNYELYDNSNDYVKKEDGKEEAKRRMEVEEVGFDVIRGASTCKTMTNGHAFKLKSHYANTPEIGKSFLLTDVSHYATQPGRSIGVGQDPSYTNRFECIPDERQFRANRITVEPFIPSIQTAMVVGPSDEEIYTDENGRVKVQFHWDREGKKDENTCCWVRVSQIHSGRGFGGIDIPRIGDEVIVSFVEGNPDRPVITGRLYNAQSMPPFQLPSHKTRTGIRSKTYKGKGHNELIFEDKTDDEMVFVHAQKNMDTRVLNDSKTRIFGNRHQIIGWEKDGKKGGDQREMVYEDKHLNVKQHHYEHIEGNMQLQVGGGEAKEGGNLDLVIEKQKCESIGGDSHLIVGGKQNQRVDGNLSLTVQGNQHSKVAGNIAAEAGAAGEIHLKAGMKIIIEAGMQLSLVGPGGFIDIGPAGVTIQGTLVKINSGGAKGKGGGCKPEKAKEAKKAKPVKPEIAKASD